MKPDVRVTIGNNPEPAVAVLQRGTDHTRLTAAELCHGIEQVGEAPQPGPERCPDLRIARCAVPGEHQHAFFGKPGNHFGRDQFRGHGDQDPALTERSQQLKYAIID